MWTSPAGDRLVERPRHRETRRASPRLPSTIASNWTGVTSRPPWRSLRLTTPTGSDTQSRMRSDIRRRRPSPPPARSIQTSSDEPPPMSKRMTPAGVRIDQRGAAGDGEARLGLAGDDLEHEARSRRAPARRTRRRSRRSGRPRWRSAAPGSRRDRRASAPQTLSASMARAIAASPRRPVWPIPSPSRTIREKASTTRKPWSRGTATSRRQLLVPRSSAP